MRAASMQLKQEARSTAHGRGQRGPRDGFKIVARAPRQHAGRAVSGGSSAAA